MPRAMRPLAFGELNVMQIIMEYIGLFFIFLAAASWGLATVGGFVELALLLAFNDRYFHFGPTIFRSSKTINTFDDDLNLKIKQKLLPGWIVRRSKDGKKYLARKSLISFHAYQRVVVNDIPGNNIVEITVRPCIIHFLFPSFVFFGMAAMTIIHSIGLIDFIKNVGLTILITAFFSLPFYLPNRFSRSKIERAFTKNF